MDWKRGMKATVTFPHSRNPVPAVVKIMAVADGYAMVRRPGCMPFVRGLKELKGVDHVEGDQ